MKFDQKKINDNDQAFVYRIAIFKEYNIIPDVEFIFLKFPNSPIQVAPKVTPESLNGYIKYVNFIAGESKKMNEENSQLRLAACDPKKRWKCGKAQTPEEEARGVWCCAYKFPKKYYSVIDKDGKIVYSSFDPIPDSKLVSFAGGKVVQKEYAGCPAFKVSDDYSIF